MANIMSMVKLRNNSSRNGFDLSSSVNFTAKFGELLPIMTKFSFPGDTFQIKMSNFTRTVPLSSATFGRAREYYDFYFVPFSLLWNKSQSVFTQMYKNSNSSSGATWKANQPFSGEIPHITTQCIEKYLVYQNKSNTPNVTNMFGFNRSDLSIKLLRYLGYQDFSYTKTLDAGSPSNVTSYDVNIFPLLAYQKIYSDWFRYSQWENSQPSTFNVDYIKGTTDCDLSNQILNTDFYNNTNFFDLQYVNHNKDLFFGLLPNTQFGDEAVVPIKGLDNQADSVFDISNGNLAGENQGSSSSVSIEGVGGQLEGGLTLNSNPSISILALRQAEYLQKWKEIAMSTEQDYKAQIKAHWDIDVPDFYSDKSRYLGGISGTLNVGEVLNTNITQDSDLANIAGKGTISSDGYIKFENKGEYGIIMCLYHCQPLVDYTLSTVDPEFFKCDSTSFLIPEMDKIGMQAVPSEWLYVGTSLDSVHNHVTLPPILGYAPRYVEYKTSIDRTLGALSDTLSNWVLNYSKDDLKASLVSNFNGQPTKHGVISYPFFKVNPHVADELFSFKADSTTDTDGLICSAYFDFKAVRNLDVNGLPY